MYHSERLCGGNYRFLKGHFKAALMRNSFLRGALSSPEALNIARTFGRFV
jgi:hypothetical protein